MKLLDILSSLMMDDTYKGRGKYHSQVSGSRRITQAARVPLGGGGCRLRSRSLSSQTSSTALEQETRERATVLQTEFENFVHASAASVAAARTGEFHRWGQAVLP